MFATFTCVLSGDSRGSVELHPGRDKYALGEKNSGYTMKEFCSTLSTIVSEKFTLIVYVFFNNFPKFTKINQLFFWSWVSSFFKETHNRSFII